MVQAHHKCWKHLHKMNWGVKKVSGKWSTILNCYLLWPSFSVPFLEMATSWLQDAITSRLRFECKEIGCKIGRRIPNYTLQH